jgi:hypothetical protein
MQLLYLEATPGTLSVPKRGSVGSTLYIKTHDGGGTTRGYRVSVLTPLPPRVEMRFADRRYRVTVLNSSHSVTSCRSYLSELVVDINLARHLISF